MAFFKDFIVALVVTGLLTRVSNYFLQKNMPKRQAAMISFGIVGIILLPILSATIGFDVAFFEYLLFLIVWLIIDLMHYSKEKKK